MKKQQAARKRRANAPWIAIRHLATALALREQTLREQAETRANIGIVEVYHFDEATGRDIVKLNPMAHWSREDVWDYIRDHRIPYNPLQDQGYRSIGCRPCTARAGEGDGERAGRWTGFSKVECGIHTFLAKKA